MNLKEYIELGFLLLLIFVLSISTVIMSEDLPMQIFAVITALGTVLSMVVYVSSLDYYLQKREFERISNKLYELFNQAKENHFQEKEESYLFSDIERLSFQTKEILKRQLDDNSSLTISILGLIQIESCLVYLIEIQSIIIKIKKHLDEVENIFLERGNDGVHSVLLNIRDFYKRVCDLTSNLKCLNDIHSLNWYRTILGKAEAEYSFVISITRSIREN